MINFNELPQDKPVGALIDKGCYVATIVEATMRTPKNGGAEYLALTYTLKTLDGVEKGKFWDNFFDVDKPIPRYKLQRLLTALGLSSLTSFELSDLTKVVNNKAMLVDITTDEKSDTPKNVVDVFSGEIYYPVSEKAAKAGIVPAEKDDDDCPFIDAKDSAKTTDAPTEY